MRAVWLIAKSVLTEAVRRKEVYVIVLISTLLIGAAITVDFFEIEGLVKFYREISLKTMSFATAATVVVLAARQLPREFEKRTIYPLLARPITRATFLLGKLLGVMLAAAFCFGLFMGIYILGSVVFDVESAQISSGTVILFFQYLWLQFLMLAILATLSFWLSMVLNFDAAVTMGLLFLIFSNTLSSVTSFLYDFSDPIGQKMLTVLTFIVPQFPLFDLSDKLVHADAWAPLGAGAMGLLTLYAAAFTSVFFSLAYLLFRRRPL